MDVGVDMDVETIIILLLIDSFKTFHSFSNELHFGYTSNFTRSKTKLLKFNKFFKTILNLTLNLIEPHNMAKIDLTPSPIQQTKL